MSRRTLSLPCQRGAGAPRRAFTLLEVMLATIIIGLGVLGLSALFAGAAKQQIDTSRLAEGVKLGQSIERTLRERTGHVGAGFVTGGAAASPDLRLGQYETANSHGFDLPFVETIWYPLSAYPPKTNAPAWPAYALAPDPNTSLDLDNPLRLFFTVEGPPDVVLYENRLNTQSGTPGPTYTGGQALQNPPAGFRVVDYRPGGGGQNDAPFLAGANGREIARLPHGRIEPGSLRIRFEIARQAFETAQSQYRGMVAARRTVTFDDANYYAELNDDNLAGPVYASLTIGGLTLTNTEGLVSSDNSAYIRINRFLDPPDAAVPAVDGRGVIEQFVLPLAGDEWVERIVLERHAYRSDRLLTLDERVRRNTDGLSVTAATVLQQRGRDGSLRSAILAYTAEPLGGPFLTGRTPRFIPPESGALDDRLLRRRSMSLHFEDTTETAYLTTGSTVSPPAYGVTRGDILLIVGDPNSPGYPGVIASGEPGSDGVLRVVRAEQRGNEFRLYLDAVPRSEGRALVGRGGSGEPPVQRDVEVWAFQHQVESLEDYIPRPNANPIRVKWKITPLEGRVVGGE